MSIKGKAGDMSGAGLAVVLTMCLSLLAVIVTACWLAIDGKDVPEVLDRVLQGLLIGVPALLAKTFRDATKGEDEPTPVSVVSGPQEPVFTAETGVTTDVGSTDVLADPELEEGAAAGVGPARRRPRP